MRNCICFVLLVVNFKKILRQFLYLPDLTKTENFFIYEIIKVIMIGKNKIFIFATF